MEQVPKASGIRISLSGKDARLKRQEEKEVVRVNRGTEVDPRFQQQDQTLRCFIMYTDHYRCERILGKGSDACSWFKDVFTSTCPNAWVEQWDELRVKGSLPWHKYRTQGDFPGDRYGDES